MCIRDSNNEAFASLEKIEVIEPVEADRAAYREAYELWKDRLSMVMANQ